MRKVIDGLLFNTETASQVAHWDNGKLPGDFHRLEETLYRTPNGRWFVHGRGGAMTRYSEPAGNGHSGGQEIRVLTQAEAQSWLEKHDRIEALDEWFSEEISPA